MSLSSVRSRSQRRRCWHSRRAQSSAVGSVGASRCGYVANLPTTRRSEAPPRPVPVGMDGGSRCARLWAPRVFGSLALWASAHTAHPRLHPPAGSLYSWCNIFIRTPQLPPPHTRTHRLSQTLTIEPPPPPPTRLPCVAGADAFAASALGLPSRPRGEHPVLCPLHGRLLDGYLPQHRRYEKVSLCMRSPNQQSRRGVSRVAGSDGACAALSLALLLFSCAPLACFLTVAQGMPSYGLALCSRARRSSPRMGQPLCSSPSSIMSSTATASPPPRALTSKSSRRPTPPDMRCAPQRGSRMASKMRFPPPPPPPPRRPGGGGALLVPRWCCRMALARSSFGLPTPPSSAPQPKRPCRASAAPLPLLCLAPLAHWRWAVASERRASAAW